VDQSPALPNPVSTGFTAILRRAVASHFSIEREIGRGGMGIVYLAHDVKLDRPVALKVLPLDLAGDATARERFLREARTAAKLAHPNIVPVYRADELDGIAFFAMAFVDGESLADRVRDRGPLAPADAVRTLREVAWALAYAHARGVVHRDVKPENVLLERGTGRALVTDFGIARSSDVDRDSAPNLTQTGAVLGTLHYMSPEQVAGEPLDGRSDLYALGVVAYYVLSGRLPFDELAGPAILLAHATRPAPALVSVAPGVPASLAAVVDRCLAKLPDERYATGEALADALERALAEAPAAARTVGPSFPEDLPAVLSEAEASAIWRRAAQLQADALHRLEERRDLLTRGVTRSPGAGGDGAAPSAGDLPVTGFALTHVVAAAEEAGISGQYVAMALAELPRGQGRDAVRVPDDPALGVSHRQATIFLGTEERSLAVSHVVPAAPARTLRALGTVLQQSPYELRLRETVGAHPLDGGVIVFDLTGTAVLVATAAVNVNFYWMGLQQQLEAKQVQVTLRQLPGEPNRTEVTMTCDLRPGVRRNVRASQWIAGVMGTATALGSLAVLAKGAAVVLSATVIAPAAAIGLASVGLTVAGYRWLYPNVFGKARDEMRRALEAVSAAVQSEDVFGTLPGPGRPHRLRPGDDGGAAAIVAGM
jgi:tRNA A-37 threonylcarbamoyl transferase component Bud32